MDAFELLKKDHQKVAGLFSRIESASGQEKLRVFAQLKAELDLHAHIEETVLYPALVNTEEAREITLEAYEEHNVVKDLLAQLSSDTTADDEWDAKLKVLKENVEHHVEEEEGEMFGDARKALGQERIEELGLELEAEKNNASGGEQESAEQESARPEMRAEAEEDKEETPGVLQRLAKLVGLGGEPSGDASSGSKKGSTARTAPKNRTKPRPAPKNAAAKKASAKAPAKRTTAKKTVAKKSGAKKTAVAAKKTAVKRASGSAKSGKATKAATRKTAGARSAKKATKATKAGARKRSTGSRTAATKSAPRAASNNRVKTKKSKQTGKSTKSKSRSR